MSDNNIYIVDAVSVGIKDKLVTGFKVYVSAKSKSAAAAYVARSFITTRIAKQSELLSMDPCEVIDAETGRPLGAAQDNQIPLPIATDGESIEQAATRLATDSDARELPAFLRADTPAVNTGD